MNLFQRFVRFLSRLAGMTTPPRLEADGPLTILANTGETIEHAASVRVIDANLDEPVANTTVRYRILDGPLILGSQRVTEIIARTDADGHAAIPVVMNSQGNGLLAAELPGTNTEPIVFIVRTEGMAHQLQLFGPPSYPAESGMVTAWVMVMDHRDRPVTGASIIFEGHIHGDHVEKGSVKETGEGIYEASFKTNMAGEWLLVAQDKTTRAHTHRCVHVLPGKPNKIQLLEKPDPRAESPYDQVIIRASLLDAFDNPLTPDRLACKLGNSVLERWIAGDEAHFKLQFAGYGDVDLIISDQEGSTSLKVTVPFSGMWMTNPGVVEPGNSFVTEVRLAPGPEKTLNEAKIKISFDEERASFVKVNPSMELPLTLQASRDGSDLFIDIASEPGIPASEWPEGIPVCSIEWNCLGSGTTCFTIEGSMSPFVQGWTLCMEQKSLRENIKCICVNIIYKGWRRQDRRLGTDMVRKALAVISSNTYFCCPILRYGWDFCEITGPMWLEIMRLWGGNQMPWTDDEIDALLDASNLCKKDKCINLYVLPIGNRNISGASRIGPPGTMIIDPTAFANVQNLSAHEFGHALGLHHVPDRYNLMHRKQPHGRYISREQCKTIWQNLGSYPC